MALIFLEERKIHHGSVNSKHILIEEDSMNKIPEVKLALQFTNS